MPDENVIQEVSGEKPFGMNWTSIFVLFLLFFLASYAAAWIKSKI